MSEYGKLAGMVIVAMSLLGAAATAVFWFGGTVHGWIRGIEDPTERGLVYVAAAIVVHAFFGGSSQTVQVDQKKSAQDEGRS